MHNYKPLVVLKSSAYLLTALIMFNSLQLAAQTFPIGFNRVLVADAIENPTVMAFAPDGRIFVAQQNGALRIVKNGALLSTAFMKLSVNSSGERGLIGLALDPNFATNQFLYVYYTVADGSRNRVSRFTASGDVVASGSEVVILNLDSLSSATNHNGGAMHFKDGLLYIAIGDNAKGANAQNLDTYHGKIIRVNTDGSIPTGNPFTTGSEQRQRVWAYGLRNPYTFAIHPTNGTVYVNDVGQNAWEEINDATVGGRNFGWPSAEGNSSDEAYVNPVFAYGHGSGDGKGCAITGGTFFNPTSTNYPAEYFGGYFYQDLCNDWINMLSFSDSTTTRLPFATDVEGDALSIMTGPDGNLYYLSRSSDALYKIIYTVNTAPAIVSQPEAVTVIAGQPASFSVTATGTSPLQYQWLFNGVAISGATSATYTIADVQDTHAGEYSVVVTNELGSVTSDAVELTVNAYNAEPVAEILTPEEGALYRGGDVINFSGEATDAEDGTLPASAFTWFVDFHHDSHAHDGPSVANGVKSGSITIPTSGEVSANVWYRIYLVVVDASGLSDTVYRDIHPRTSTIKLLTQPEGLQLTLDGQPISTPLTVTSVEGIERSIGIVSPQDFEGQSYTFTEWLHGGTATQTISTPENDVTYTAVYTLSNLRDPENPTNLVNGLSYSYYEGAWETLPDFGSLSPSDSGSISNVDLSPRNREDDFGFKFTGYINIPTDGAYTFYTNSDDGSQLFIGDTLVVDNNGLHGAQERDGTIGLKAGKHAIRILFFEHLGSSLLTTSYSGPDIDKQVIPDTVFYRPSSIAPPQTLEAESASLTGAVVQKNHTGYTGTGFVDFVAASGESIQWSVSITQASTYSLLLRYALGSGTRKLSIAVNGTVINSSLSFPATGGWSTWSTVDVSASLNVGVNTITLSSTGSSGPNIDNISINQSSLNKTVASARNSNTYGITERKISVYPNPVASEVQIALEMGGNPIKVEIINLQGQILYSQPAHKYATENVLNINLESVPNGTYILRVHGNGAIHSQLLTIQR